MNITNFRELGGYETVNGSHVKSGCFYRSAPIIFTDDEEREEFKALGIKTVLDFRSSNEREENPDSQVEGCTYISCSAIPEDKLGGNFDLPMLFKTGKIAQLTDYVKEIYRELPFNNKAYRILFDLLRKNETPVVFHCSAGKDRTGFAAYLILRTLGVSDETAMKDYLLSNEYRKEENEKLIQQMPQITQAGVLIYVMEECLQNSIDAIVKKYGDFESYLAAEYGITEEEIKTFREKYLED